MILQKLKKKFGYFIAANKAEMDKLNEQELLESLLIFNLDSQIVYSVADFVNYWRVDEQSEKEGFIVLSKLFTKHVEQIVHLAHNVDPQLAEKILQDCKESLCQIKK
jgi:hypothetical protein